MIERLRFLDRQIQIQEEALVNARSTETARVHSYLLEKVTKEWCDLMERISEADMAVYLGSEA